MVKEIIFDFDGTIADSFETIMSLFEKHKGDLGLDQFGKREIEIYRNEGVGKLIKEFKISLFKISKTINEIRKQTNELLSDVNPFGGVADLLKQLKEKNLVLGIMSTNGEKTINSFLKKNKINVFDYVIGKGNLLGKDRVIKSILKKRNLKKDEVLYVGDEVRDIRACKKLGVKIAAVTWGFNEEDLLKGERPDFLIRKPGDILDLV